MKRVYTFWLCMILLLQGYLYAQESPLPIFQPKAEKPLLFAALPDSFEVKSGTLQQIISAETNEQITLQLSNQFTIYGLILDKYHQGPGNFSVNVRLQNYHNALFNINVKLLADNSIAIQGRIIHPRYGDVLVLNNNKKGYFFKKQLQKLFMPE